MILSSIKKQTIVATVCGLMIISGPSLNTLHAKGLNQNEQVDIYQASSEWEYIGNVAIYGAGFHWFSSTSQHQQAAPIEYKGKVKAYVKVIGNRSFYKGIFEGEEYTISVNPNYNPNSNDESRHYKYVMDKYYIKSL